MKTPEELEQLFDRTLREQPLRPAPRSLQARVLAEIEKRQARPWWQKSFAHWPLAARIVFFAASIGFVKVGLQSAMWVSTSLRADALAIQLPAEVSWIPSIFTAAGFVARSLPPLWLYGALAVMGAMYMVLFAVSAAAYRTVQPQH